MRLNPGRASLPSLDAFQLLALNASGRGFYCGFFDRESSSARLPDELQMSATSGPTRCARKILPREPAKTSFPAMN